MKWFFINRPALIIVFCTLEKRLVEEENTSVLARSTSTELPGTSINSSTTLHSPIMAHVDRLCRSMNSNTVSLISRKNKGNIRRSHPTVESKYRKRIIIIDYPGNDTSELELFSEYDKLYDGTVMISTAMMEDNVRIEILGVLKKKVSTIFNFSEVKIDDLEFVKYANRKIRVFDSDHSHDGKVLKQLYGGSVYAHFRCPVPLLKVSYYKNLQCLLC